MALDLLRYRIFGQPISFADINEVLGLSRTSLKGLQTLNNSAYIDSVPFINRNSPKVSDWYEYYRPTAWRGIDPTCVIEDTTLGICAKWLCDYIFHETDPGGQPYDCIVDYNDPYGDGTSLEPVMGTCYTPSNGYNMWTTSGEFNFSNLLNVGETINDTTTNVYVESIVYQEQLNFTNVDYTTSLGSERNLWTLNFGLANYPGYPQYAGKGFLYDDTLSFDVPETDGIVITLRLRGSIVTSTGRTIPINIDSTAESPIGVAPSFLNTCDIPVTGNVCGDWESFTNDPSGWGSDNVYNTISGSVNFSSILQPGETIINDGESNIRLSSYTVIGNNKIFNIWESFGHVELYQKYINNAYDFITVNKHQEGYETPADKLKFTGIINTSLGRKLYLSDVTSQHVSFTPWSHGFGGTSINTNCVPILNVTITATTKTNPTNQEGTNGTATITFMGGIGPYTYTLNSVIQGAASSPLTINGLLASTTYTVQIIDSNNNMFECTITIGIPNLTTSVINGITYTNQYLLEFDYLVIKYSWGSTAGTDLDTFTGVINSGTILDNDWVGFAQGSSVPNSVTLTNSYIYWAGDNRQTGGSEAVFMNFSKIRTDYNLSTISTKMNAVWYSNRQSGNITIEVKTYLGGVMSLSGFDFINTGGTVVQTLPFNKNIPTSSTSANIANSTSLGYVEYVGNTKTGRISIIQ